MLIKFKGTDPRAGTVAQMDSIRGQQLIDGGMAVLHSENAVPAIDPIAAQRAHLDAAIALLPGSFTDPDYVAIGMRFHYGDTFTADDEAKVRELVKRPAPLQSSVSAADGVVADTVVTPSTPSAAPATPSAAPSAVTSTSADALTTSSSRTRAKR